MKVWDGVTICMETYVEITSTVVVEPRFNPRLESTARALDFAEANCAEFIVDDAA